MRIICGEHLARIFESQDIYTSGDLAAQDLEDLIQSLSSENLADSQVEGFIQEARGKEHGHLLLDLVGNEQWIMHLREADLKTIADIAFFFGRVVEVLQNWTNVDTCQAIGQNAIQICTDLPWVGEWNG